MNQISERLRDSAAGRKILDRWSWFQYLPLAVKVRWGGYAALGAVALVVGLWQLSRLGTEVPDTTALRAEQIRQQASAPPPEATPDVPPQHTGPEPQAVRGGGMPRD